MSAPILFLAGVPKAGTSSLFGWLADHPQVQGSHEKESCFFADPGSHVFRPTFNAGQGIERLADAFPPLDAATRLRVEGTPSTIYSRTALALIPELPKARALFVLREPASQIRSGYDYFRDNWDYIPAGMSFPDYLAAVRAGTQVFGGNELAANALACADYLPWLERWRDRLDPARMKVVTFDRLRTDPTGLVTEIADWCGIDPAFYAAYAFPVENESYTPRNRALQRLNIAVRGALPKGRVYSAARALYRTLNTRPPERDGDAAFMVDLRRGFAEKNARLAEAFDLDLSGWAP
ncbi:hypothetical protein BMG00_16060 [Thioclava marina]|uniref:Sulfotransferase domain-containing protein n=1 Tax=Thioclava marina TaxID=1915077 RepID=A0ABX3MI50_9RHOB|nr:sulfotransferase domain-containing protein [Thioclava marina]OOY11241.1 hypothetical protein BMG00_16060 [Thioclava marina]